MASMKGPDVNLIHLILRLLIAVGSFISVIFKVPFSVYAAINVSDLIIKLSTTGGGGGGNSTPSTEPSDEPAPDEPKPIDVNRLELAVNMILLVILFIAVMFILCRVVYQVVTIRLISAYSYLVIMGLWITLVLIAIMVIGWDGPLNYAILMTRYLLIGWYIFTVPTSWHFVLLRASIIADILTYPAVIGLAILNMKYKFAIVGTGDIKIGVDRKVGVWTRYNNLIRTL